MKTIITSLALACCTLSCLWVQAQSLEEVRAWYAAGEYLKVTNMAADAANAELLILQGDSHLKQQSFTKAMEKYESAEAAGSKDEARLHKGICFYEMRDYTAAESIFLNHLDRYQGHPVAMYYLASVRYMDYEQKDAIQILNDLLALDPSNMEALYLRATCHMELNKNDKARDDYAKALDIRPDFLRTKLNLAIVDLELGNYEAATDMLKDLLFEEIDFHKEVFYYLAEVKYAQHNHEGACEDWKESASLGDVDAEETYKAICLDSRKKPKRRASSAAF